MPGPMPATLDYAEAAAYLGISQRLLRKRVAVGDIRHVRIGRLVKFRAVDLDDYLERSARGGAPRGRGRS